MSLFVKQEPVSGALNDQKATSVTIVDVDNNTSATLALAEGIALANYQFLKYRKEAKKETYSLKTIHINSKVSDKDIAFLRNYH